MKLYILTAILSFFLLGCATSNKILRSTVQTRSVTDVKWEKLNPARGEKSPKAANLWGDRKDKVPTGFLVKFVDGFSSPPHIHNVTYRGIVLNGLIHNDDPSAAVMWMPKSSYWTQPAGEAHITSAKGTTNIAFIEIDSGPYLVRPVSKAFDNGERPIHVQNSNITWVDKGEAKVAFLWKDSNHQISGRLVEFRNSIIIGGQNNRVVVVDGSIEVDEKSNRILMPGSLITMDKDSSTTFLCRGQVSCIVYVKSDGNLVLN
ncbi:DUF4437 domain-containing protein [Nitrospina watsonii]|uniref:DUF4437 domain-containing protein n=1 Tax=Nitrospina watsonii TaxID=1323948 RepID=UPI0024914A7A|nr:DUF4437 domain-containing protein [Nitrospina watsonii]